ncbi:MULTISPECIES: acyl-CoA dehydrogenase family protein [unclassified Rhodococcus (in: high G+C Gram-positive bacteria)]|uniref:acyl-CoA dehydrogenase family protein n=1 Tax=unclassified Rhodococcus (in: high G+C Gram-positive bacteria) TaxID=192944 RepID=UPI0006F84345|nr:MULTISPECIES: acyl-CoA dehydrogenase family protein [unclassified Rhodococcus (in: high G+C Gram-positive bacteria)]KQU39590.1 DNA alkylation response protein [Rhodococcus sp. Leaf225]KQU44027.1 DNA alkylation response protein [Rhodococcus sp. Leaf258]
MTPTHTVTNQVPPLIGYDVADHPVVLEALHREGADDALDELHRLGRLAGSEQAQRWGDLAEEHPPVLHTHDRYGNRIDEVVYDPAYHELMRTAVEFGMHGAPWRDPSPNAHLIRAAKFSVWGAVDAGHGCPISMTYAVVPALRANAELSALYEPLLTSSTYDPSYRTPATKTGLIAGMSMTEKQGGSDVRANRTTAVPQPDGSYRITGHKWFTSAPMSDVLLVLAQAPGGLSCFFLPRVLPDGTRNAMAIQRLKDKLGNHSNASSEVEYDDATAWLVGDEGRGVRTIIEMVNMTRLDCTLGSATGMRAGTAAAVHHAVHRQAFGKNLVDQPLMRNVLADLAIESEASTTVALWLAALTDQAAAGDERAAALRRISLSVSKYLVCKRGPAHAAEALECLGGNGYAEESRMPRLYREAPLLSVWEGSGNVAALDTLRAVARQPETLAVFFDELDGCRGADAALDAAVRSLKDSFTDIATLEQRARRVVGEMALALQGSLLVRHGHPAVADAFTTSRLGGDWGSVYGTLPTGVDTAAIIERSTPKVPA